MEKHAHSTHTDASGSTSPSSSASSSSAAVAVAVRLVASFVGVGDFVLQLVRSLVHVSEILWCCDSASVPNEVSGGWWFTRFGMWLLQTL